MFQLFSGLQRKVAVEDKSEWNEELVEGEYGKNANKKIVAISWCLVDERWRSKIWGEIGIKSR